MTTVTFEGCFVEHETDSALLVHIPEVADDPQWVPKSKKVWDRDESEVQRKGDKGTLVVAEWFATEKEWV
jgi:G:T-mismatch repair DNA endonuclease (very short patch repair protein)